MVRKPRIYYQGALYHVICRGNNREKVFENDDDKQSYLHIVSRYKKKFNFYLYCYCVMDNHVHLVIEVQDTPLSKIMQGIQQVYTFHFNKKYDRVGHAFQQRFKAILVDKQEYLLQLIRYVHNNPVKGNLADGLNYLWSSHRYYIKKDYQGLVDKEFPLSLFSGNYSSQINNYLVFMGKDSSTYEQKQESELWPANYKDLVTKQSDVNSISLSVEDAIIKVEKVTGIGLSDIKKRSKRRTIVKARRLLVYLLDRYSHLNRKAIADLVNISQSSVSIIIEDEQIRRECKKLLKN